MDHNECNNQLRATLHDIFGLGDSDSLHGNEDSYGGYVESPDRYLDTDDEGLQNLDDEEMNRSHQSVEDEDLCVSNDEEDHYGEDDMEEEEGPMHDDSYTEEQYTSGPVEGMSFRYVQTDFAFYKEHSRLTGFGVVKKSEKKLAGQLKELSRTVKRSLVAHDIADLRPSKSIRLLENLAYVHGRNPSNAILTDQYESIKAAIHEVLPNTVNKYCIWDIFTKLPVNLKWVTNYKPAKARFKAIIFDSITIAEFEDKWQDFIEEYDLGSKVFTRSGPSGFPYISSTSFGLPTEESFDIIQRDTEQVFKAMAELDEQMRRLQERLEFMMIRVNAMEERFENMPPKKRTMNQSAPQLEDPLGEHISHVEFRAAFTTLAQSVVALNE
ncbi:hypothetical protein CQW23_23446 [Capsicum baccatum]|uniref:Uncharacterized protein n=1 Tax=Capsicum baccatum TaxID=33114 RepID=A0A2G2VS08_CAPBA|nr:hypothetical protein CQW23_23446 [Capsicum baccatum]